MEENIKFIYEDIINATSNSNDLLEELKSIKGPSIIIGNGGSEVVATFLAKVLSKKNHLITSVHDSCNLSSLELSNYENIIIASYSGTNHGVKNVFNYNLKKYMLTTRLTPIDDETLLTYHMEHRKSFISLNQTIVPMAVILKYYLGDIFDEIIEDIFKLVDKTINYELGNVTNIFTDYKTLTTSVFLESTLAESGISIPITHSKYNYCHGRSTINKDHNYDSIYLINNKKDIDDILLSILNKKIILEGTFQDEIVNDFFLTLQAIYLLCNIAKSKNIDLSKIDYDKQVVKKLYYFKGSM